MNLVAVIEAQLRGSIARERLKIDEVRLQLAVAHEVVVEHDANVLPGPLDAGAPDVRHLERSVPLEVEAEGRHLIVLAEVEPGTKSKGTADLHVLDRVPEDAEVERGAPVRAPLDRRRVNLGGVHRAGEVAGDTEAREVRVEPKPIERDAPADRKRVRKLVADGTAVVGDGDRSRAADGVLSIVVIRDPWRAEVKEDALVGKRILNLRHLMRVADDTGVCAKRPEQRAERQSEVVVHVLAVHGHRYGVEADPRDVAADPP